MFAMNNVNLVFVQNDTFYNVISIIKRRNHYESVTQFHYHVLICNGKRRNISLYFIYVTFLDLN